jgi:hypothetical protein
VAVAELTPEERYWLDLVVTCQKQSEDDLKPWRDLGNERYALYRGVKAYREAWRRSGRRDRDEIADEAATDWSSDLHIPLAFSTVETILPRAVSNRPRGLVLPNDGQAESNVENMRMLVEVQQERMGYELTNQDTAKSGFIYGLGAQKLTWRYIQRQQRYLGRAIDPQAAGSEWVEKIRNAPLWDDPWAEDLDIGDLFWDPAGYGDYTGIGFNLGWILHRTWRRTDYVWQQVRSGAWNSPAVLSMSPEDIEAASGGQMRRDEVFRDRMNAAGENVNAAGESRYGRIHEVWEYWGDGMVITVLNRTIPVAIRRNPFFHGLMPFHFYRPTTQGMKRLHGIGEIEPIADLIRELNLIRSQRRDNAALVLQQVWAFDEDAIDRDHLVFGPGMAIPTRGGSPKDALHKIDVGDIPFSGYKEEEAIKSDADRTSGVSDALAGAEGVTGGAASTATGAQLVAAAANARIENKSRRFEVETVKPLTEQQISLNQQMIVSREETFERPPLPGEIDPMPWKRVKLTPAELFGQMSYRVNAGALMQKNVAQEAQLGQNLWNSIREDPSIVREVALKHFIESQGVPSAQASSWIRPPEPTVPIAVLQQLAAKKGYGGDLMKTLDYVLNGQAQNG